MEWLIFIITIIKHVQRQLHKAAFTTSTTKFIGSRGCTQPQCLCAVPSKAVCATPEVACMPALWRVTAQPIETWQPTSMEGNMEKKAINRISDFPELYKTSLHSYRDLGRKPLGRSLQPSRYVRYAWNRSLWKQSSFLRLNTHKCSWSHAPTPSSFLMLPFIFLSEFLVLASWHQTDTCSVPLCAGNNRHIPARGFENPTYFALPLACVHSANHFLSERP